MKQESQCTHKRNIEEPSLNHYSRPEKQYLLHILSVCQQLYLSSTHANEPCYIVICGLSSCTIFFYNISWEAFFGKVYWICSTNLSKTLLILRRIQRDIVINVYRSSCKVPVILVRTEWNLNFLNRFSKNAQILNFVKIRPVEAELFHVEEQMDRQTDRYDGANSRFWQFCVRAWKLLSLRPFLAKSQSLSKLLWACPALICIHLGLKWHKIREKFDIRSYVKNGLRCTTFH